MPRVQYTSLSEKLKQEMATLDDTKSGKILRIPDIITFCEDARYLGLKKVDKQGNEIRGLRQMQKIILKIFYRGSIGNEDLKLTEDELQHCNELGLNDINKGDVISKYGTNDTFRELVLVWGRRSGKTYLFSIIALYEAMKLLESPCGDPYEEYKIDSGAEISILTVATSSDQARLAFNETKAKLIKSPYFSDKFKPEGVGIDSIYLLTPQDKKDNKENKRRRIAQKKGSICIEVGHSNSTALRGKQIFVLLFDEIAQYVQTAGPASDEMLYTALEPSVNTFFRTQEIKDRTGHVAFDKNGDPLTEKIFDGKIICISSPRGSEGKLYNLFNDAPSRPFRLACRLPTWEVNTELTEEDLRTNSNLDDAQFIQEYGAEFSGTAGSTFFPRDYVERVFNNSKKKRAKIVEIGQPGTIYFAHIDPANTSHNYALVICHKELFLNRVTKTVDFVVVVDHIRHWSPKDGNPIMVDQIDEYVISLRHRFFLGLVTYDQWNSASSIHKLRKAGIPSKCTYFNRKYKMAIYDELYNLVIGEKLVIPEYELLKQEMFHLQRKITPNGYRVVPSKTGQVQTDDITDALAGACYNAIQSQFNTLPRSMTVNTGISGTENSREWQTMSGSLGYGTGQQVAKNLERIKSYPRR